MPETNVMGQLFLNKKVAITFQLYEMHMLFRVISKYTKLMFLWQKFWIAFMLSKEFYYERFKESALGQH